MEEKQNRVFLKCLLCNTESDLHIVFKNKLVALLAHSLLSGLNFSLQNEKLSVCFLFFNKIIHSLDQVLVWQSDGLLEFVWMLHHNMVMFST